MFFNKKKNTNQQTEERATIKIANMETDNILIFPEGALRRDESDAEKIDVA